MSERERDCPFGKAAGVPHSQFFDELEWFCPTCIDLEQNDRGDWSDAEWKQLQTFEDPSYDRRYALEYHDPNADCYIQLATGLLTAAALSDQGPVWQKQIQSVIAHLEELRGVR